MATGWFIFTVTVAVLGGWLWRDLMADGDRQLLDAHKYQDGYSDGYADGYRACEADARMDADG